MIRGISAESLRQCRLKVTFNDGVSEVFPVEPERRDGVFLKLLAPRVFNAATVNPDLGCGDWPGGVDLCPNAMYQANTLTQPGYRANSLHQQPGNCSRLTCRPVPCAAAG